MNKSVLIASLVATSLLAAIAGCKTDNGGQSSTAACGALYDANDAYSANCAPTTRYGDRAAFVKTCETDLAAPGASGVTGSFTDCANFIQGLVATCGNSDSTVCRISGGSLAGGAACGNNLQCASEWCKGGGVTESATGGTLAFKANCGVCADKIAVGQPCQSGDKCVDDAMCNVTGSNGGTCIAVVKNDVGGHCSSLPGTTLDVCKANLRCGPDQKCLALSATGGDCVVDSDCNYPLACSNKVCGDAKSAGATCDPNAAGSGCARDLICDVTSKACIAVTLIQPGGACDEAGKPCAQGTCNTAGTGTDGGEPTGTCPAVLNDGDACDTASLDKVCGTGEFCLGGKCAGFDPGTCK